MDGVTENIQNQLNSKQDKITVTGFLVGRADGAVTGVEDTFVSYDSLSDVEAASSPNDWHIGDNGNWFFGAMDSGKSSKGADGKDGTNGTNGADGAPGSDGYSPTASVTSTSTGATITITDKTGTTTATVKNGTNGTNGTNGNDGKSAYASAQSGGYTGTEAAFNTALAQVQNKADKSVRRSVTLYTSYWNTSSKTQSVTVTGITTDANCIITSSPDCYMAYAEAGVRCTAQGSDTLTFQYEEFPKQNLRAIVLILG